MSRENYTLQNRLYLIAAIILLVGLGSSILIYLAVPDDSDDMMLYEFEHSKMYRHDLELYGGKINVLASEFMRWVKGLWHGKSLAITVASIAGIISLVLLYIAYHLPSGVDSSGRDRDNHDITHE